MLKELIEQKKAYVEKEANDIINYLVNNKKTSCKISTCDHSNWNTELHDNFGSISDYLKEKGLKVSHSVSYGVHDWTISV